MLKLNNITKSYIVGDFSQIALKSVSLEFDSSEFVAILGQSGSGKTTLLNIIGGLDRYNSGELIINGKSTRNFKANDWDAYRNNSIGFVFQNYNLIGHISVLANVEMAMTLSGISHRRRRQKALAVLQRVGLLEHAKKKPGQLSGGQMQRVAIARALANDPDIILADEPTGALDTETSIQILDLISEIARDKLVIMVTHNPALAKRYSTRVIELRDGEVISDTGKKAENEKQAQSFSLKKTAMSFAAALKLSFNNIMTKKGRTLLTAFASSIGITGIALILSLSSGFNIKIEEFETGAMSEYPIIINKQSLDLNQQALIDTASQNEFPAGNEIYPYSNADAELLHTNKLTEDYVSYVEKADSRFVSGISFTRALGLNILARSGETVRTINALSISMSELPQGTSDAAADIVTKNYDILSGALPVKKEDILLVVDSRNRIDKNLVQALGMNESAEALSLSDFVGMELRLVLNNDYYQKNDKFYSIRLDLDKVYDSENCISLNICGVVRQKQGSMLDVLSPGIAYTYELAEHVIADSKESDIVKSLMVTDYNILTGESLNISTEEGKEAKEALLAYLGASRIPYAIMIYPKDFDSKDEITAYLDRWNDALQNNDKIIYTDTAAIITTLTGSIVDAITIVLIAFSAISLVVSMIMIGIITYISVLERTREIGVLRALGARKKDITRVFNAETFIVGLFSGILGITVAWLLTFPANEAIEWLSKLPDVAQLNPVHALILIAISLLLTLIGGFIPAKIAAKKDPVTALRVE